MRASMGIRPVECDTNSEHSWLTRVCFPAGDKQVKRLATWLDEYLT